MVRIAVPQFLRPGSKGWRQITGLNRVAARENHQLLDHMFQFADISGPEIIHQCVEGFRGNGRFFQAEFATNRFRK